MTTSSLTVRAAGVRSKREELGISRAALALGTGLPADTLWEIEGGTTSPPSEIRVRLMRVLDAEFDELFAVSASSSPLP